jgi:hypothetical protein
MGFLTPALLIGLLAAAVPPIIHLIHRRQVKEVRFPALEFILRANRKTARRHRIRQLLLMAIRSLLMGLLAFAVAQPFIQNAEVVVASAGAGSGSTVLVVDASYPMQYALDGETLLDRARLTAGRVLDGLGADGQVGLVVAGDRIDIPTGEPTRDVSAVRRALDSVEAGHRHGNLGEAVSRAFDLLADQPAGAGRRVVVLTTAAGAASGLPRPADAPEGERIEVIPVDVAEGAPVPNRAVVEIDARPAPELGADQWRVDARIANYGDEAVAQVPLALDIDGETRVRGFIDLGPGEVGTKTFHVRHEGDAPARAAVVLDADPLLADDTRAFWLRPAPRVRVLVVNGEPKPTPYRDELFYLERALTPGLQGAARFRVTIADADTLDRHDFGEFDVVVFANFATPAPAQARALEAWVRQGGGLLITMGGKVEPAEGNDALGALLPRTLRGIRTAGDAAASAEGRDRRAARPNLYAREHPILRTFGDPAATSIARTRVRRYMLLDPAPDASGEVVIGLDDGAPLLLTRGVERGRVALLTTSVDRDWGDLPIRADFLPLVQQLIRYLTRVTELEVAPVLVGRAAPVRSEDPRVERVRITGPDGRQHTSERPRAPNEKWTFARAVVPGHYAVVPDPPLPDLPTLPGFSVAIDPAGADLRGPKAEAVADAGDEARKRLQVQQRTELWHAALAFLFVLLIAEAALLFRRRKEIEV